MKKYVLLMLAISIMGCILSVLIKESILTCDIFLMLGILLFDKFIGIEDKKGGQS